MELFFEQADMYKALQKVQKAIPVRTPMNILKGVCLDLTGSRLTLTATDLELGIRTRVEVRGMADGSLILPERFVEIVKNLPPGPAHMKVEKDVARVEAEDVVFHLQGLPAEEFPNFPESRGEDTQVRLPGFLLMDMVQKTLVTVSPDQSKPAFTGVHFHLAGDVLRLTSSDTFRLSVIRDRVRDMKVEETDFIAPAKSLRELVRILREEDLVELRVAKGLALFSFGDTVLSTSLLAEKFPNVSRVIPQDAFTRVKVNKNLLEMSLNRAHLLADSEVHTVNLQVTPGQLTLDSASSLGSNTEKLPLISFEGEEVTLIMNIRFLYDVLKVIPGGEVQLRFKGRTGPCIMEPLTDLDYLYLALPVRPD
jgi:DNA polymerase III subunit beta